MISYFVYTVISLGCSYGLYMLLLRKQKTFQFNRFFLLISMTLCLVAPFLEFQWFESVPSITKLPIKAFTDAVVISENIEDVIYGTNEMVSPSKNSPLLYFYIAVSLFLVLRFFKNSFQLYRLTRGEYERFGRLKIIKSADSDMVSSFFNYMFVGEIQVVKEGDYFSILKHETIHCQQLHTADVILIELLICIFWCNPFIWLYRKVILQNHEYLADDQSISSGIDIENYSNTIINSGYKEHRVPLTSGFNFIQIKNRIIMLHQSKSSVLNRTLKITTALLLFSGIFAISCSYETMKEPLVVVIDAGHGGEDSGSFNEKDIVLNISNQLALLSNDRVKIITTRATDKFSSLEERVSFINTVNADLVISLHCNTYKNESINGVEAYYDEKSDFKVESIDYSKILLESQMELFSVNRGVKTASIYVLKHINSPGIVLELGFMSNKNDLAILMNTERQNKMAKSLFDGLMKIRKMYPRK